MQSLHIKTILYINQYSVLKKRAGELRRGMPKHVMTPAAHLRMIQRKKLNARRRNTPERVFIICARVCMSACVHMDRQLANL